MKMSKDFPDTKTLSSKELERVSGGQNEPETKELYCKHCRCMRVFYAYTGRRAKCSVCTADYEGD